MLFVIMYGRWNVIYCFVHSKCILKVSQKHYPSVLHFCLYILILRMMKQYTPMKFISMRWKMSINSIGVPGMDMFRYFFINIPCLFSISNFKEYYWKLPIIHTIFKHIIEPVGDNYIIRVNDNYWLLHLL